MRERLFATVDASGLPCSKVPFACMWDLVEYLSFQRVAVTYRYDKSSHYTATFERIDLEAAQCLLDEWVQAPKPELQTA